MPYDFPKRRLRTNELPDTRGLNDDFAPGADKFARGLDHEDINPAEFKANVAVASGAYHTVDVNRTISDPHFGTPGASQYPDSLDANAVYVPHNGDWVVLETQIRTTKSGAFWILATGQYVWLGFIGSGISTHLSGGTRAAGVQFAIRVDGRIIDKGLTGSKDPYNRPFFAIRHSNQRVGVSALPGPCLQRTQVCSGIGPEMYSARLTPKVPVEEGTHTIELLVRRRRTARFSVPVLASGDDVYVYNRMLNPVFFPQHAGGTVAMPSAAEVTAFKKSDVLSTASLGTDRAIKQADAYNNIPIGGVRERGLGHQHLPPVLIDHAWETLVPASQQTTDAKYPGFTSSTITTSPSTGATGWYLLNNGAGKDLDTNTDHAGLWDDSVDSIFIVLANVQFKSVGLTTLGREADLGHFAAFTIGMNLDGASVVMQQHSHAFFNNYNWWGREFSAAQTTPEEIDVALLQVFEWPAGSGDIDKFGVYCSSMEETDLEDPLITYRRGSILVMQLRGN